MKLNESKLTAMVEAVKNEFDGFFEDIILGDLRIERLRTALTKYAMELTDEEIMSWVLDQGYYGHCTTEWREGLEDGAKFARDYGK